MKNTYSVLATAAILVISFSNSVTADTAIKCTDICAEIAFWCVGNLTQYQSEIEALIPSKVQVYCVRAGTTNFEPIYLNDTQADLSRKLDLTKRVAWATHGYNIFKVYQAGEDWLHDLATKWAKNGDSNVCYVKWLDLAENPSYFVIAKIHIPLIVKYLLKYINYLKKTIGIDINATILVGHSLGAVLMGGIAHELLEAGYLIDLLVLLDSAQPCETCPQRTADRPLKEYARTVLAVHANIWLGQNNPVGCLDVYLDVLLKPSCQEDTLKRIGTNLTQAINSVPQTILNLITTDPLNGLTNLLNLLKNNDTGLNPQTLLIAASAQLFTLVVCSHGTAYKVFISSLDPVDPCRASPCLNLFNTVPRVTVGVYCDRQCYPGTIFTLPTNDSAPYCPAPDNVYEGEVCALAKVAPVLAVVEQECYNYFPQLW